MSTIAAGTTSGTALVSTGDTSGQLVLQTNGTTTAVTIGTNQVVTLAQPLPVGSGGTGATSLSSLSVGTATNLAGGGAGQVPYNTASNTTAFLAAGTSGQVLQSNGASAPSWGSVGVAAGGTGQTSLTANNVLLGNGTSAVQFVAPGTNGNVLTSNGTTWTSTAPAGGGAWTYLGTVTAASSSTVDVENFFSSTYDFYRIEIVGLRSTWSGVDNLFCRLKVGGTYQTANYSYAVMWVGSSTGITAISSANSSNIQMTSSFQTAAGGNNSYAVVNGEVFVYIPSSTSYYKGISFNFFNAVDDSSYRAATNVGSGLQRLPDALTGLRFYTNNSIATGTFRVYGLKNS